MLGYMDTPEPAQVTAQPVPLSLRQFAAAVGVTHGRVAALQRSGVLERPITISDPEEAKRWWVEHVQVRGASPRGTPAVHNPTIPPAELAALLDPKLEEEDYGSVLLARARIAARRAYELLITAMSDPRRRPTELATHLTNHSKAVESHAYARKQHLEYLQAAGELVELSAAREAVASVVKSLDLMVAKLPSRIACSPETKVQIEREVTRIREAMSRGPEGVEKSLSEHDSQATVTIPETDTADD